MEEKKENNEAERGGKIYQKEAWHDFLTSRVILEDMEDIFNRDVELSRLSDKTFLVSGAYGMLASYLVYFLIYLNELKGFNIKIISLSRNEEKFLKRFGKYAKREYFSNITADLNLKLEIHDKIDYVIHAASLASPQHYAVCPREVALPNILGTNNLLELAVEKRVESFLFFSTGSVYGKTDKPFLGEDDFGVVNPLDIHSCYDESKRMGETLCKIYNHQKSVPVKIARFGHTYGPTLDIDNDPRVFAEFTRNAVRGENIEMKSDGLAKRAFCYIADATAGEIKILLDGVNGEAYNISNTKEIYAIKDLAKIVAEVGNVSFIRKDRDDGEHYMEAPFAGIGDNSKLRKLGWCCNTDARCGFLRTINAIKTTIN